MRRLARERFTGAAEGFDGIRSVDTVAWPEDFTEDAMKQAAAGSYTFTVRARRGDGSTHTVADRQTCERA